MTIVKIIFTWAFVKWHLRVIMVLNLYLVYCVFCTFVVNFDVNMWLYFYLMLWKSITFLSFHMISSVNEKEPTKSTVIGRPILLALEDVDGTPSFLEKALKFLEEHGEFSYTYMCLCVCWKHARWERQRI
jgi:hypothetical protein